MNTRPLTFIICLLTISSFSTLDRSAVAEQIPSTSKLSQSLTLVDLEADETDNWEAIKIGTKYGYKDAADRLKIPARFDDVYEFFDGVAALGD